jgi:ubiquinone/menaquinone biosynthesis C-methylase UbiE
MSTMPQDEEKTEPTLSYDSLVAYDKHLSNLLALNAEDRDLAFAQAIGSPTVEQFRAQGDGQVSVLRAHGLADGMTIFDLGCGCGRTAQALHRSTWQGSYVGTDIVTAFVEELNAKCPGYSAKVHRHSSIPAPNDSLDMVFHWSVFTHLSPEECYLYMVDIHRALKPRGRLVFSFLELTEPAHQVVFYGRTETLAQGGRNAVLDAFLHRDWISVWAKNIGFSMPEFTHGSDGTRHDPFWQTLVAMMKL